MSTILLNVMFNLKSNIVMVIHVFQKMDHAANIFVDELVNISDNGFVSDIKVSSI